MKREQAYIERIRTKVKTFNVLSLLFLIVTVCLIMSGILINAEILEKILTTLTLFVILSFILFCGFKKESFFLNSFKEECELYTTNLYEKKEHQANLVRNRITLNDQYMLLGSEFKVFVEEILESCNSLGELEGYIEIKDMEVGNNAVVIPIHSIRENIKINLIKELDAQIKNGQEIKISKRIKKLIESRKLPELPEYITIAE